MAEKKPAAPKKPAKVIEKAAAVGLASGAKQAAKKTAAKKTSPVPKTAWIIQSPFGVEVSLEEIQKRIGMPVNKVYIRTDHKKAYWVRGEECGEVDLW